MERKYTFLVLIALMSLMIAPASLLNGQGCDNLISYWRLEEKTGNTYEDIIGGHDAVAITSAPSQGDGKVGKAQSFNGTTNYLTISDNPDFDWSGTQSFTIELWVKLQSIATDDNMIFIGRDEAPGSIHWWIGAEKNTGRSVFTLVNSAGTSNLSYGPNLIIGTWYHMVAVRDASTGTTTLYVNNTVVDSDVIDYSAGSFGTDASIDIGVLNYNGSYDRFYAPAVIDEVAIYNTALSSTDIDLHFDNGAFGIGYCQDFSPYFLSIPDSLAVVGTGFTYEAYATGLPTLMYSMVSGPGSISSTTGIYSWTPSSVNQSGSKVTIKVTNPQGTATQSFRVFVAEAPDCPSGIQNMFKLNETSGAPYQDFKGGNDGEALNPPSPTGGKFAGAQEFDGFNDGINVPDDGTYNFPKNSSFSFEFWVKTPGSSSTNMVCIGRQGSVLGLDTSKTHLWVGVEKNTGAAMFYLMDAHGNEPVPNGLIKGGYIAGDTWHYVVGVRDGATRKSYLYVDGGEVAVSETFSYSNSFGTFPGDPLNIGFLYKVDGTPKFFYKGALDEVAIYTRALSASEISQNYMQSFSGTWHCEPGNYGPAFISEPVTDATENEAYFYNIETDDIDIDDVLMLSLTKPDWLTFTDFGNGAGTLSGKPLNEDIGPHSVVITVSDGKTPVNQEFTINVANRNDPPIISSSPDLTVDEDVAYSYTMEASDVDVDDVLTFIGTTIPDWLVFNSITHELSGTPDNDDVAVHDVVLEVTDGDTTIIQSFTITVVNVNDLPEITDHGVLSTNEDTDIVLSLNNLTVIDVDNEPGDLTLVLESGINYTFSGTTVTPAENYYGTLLVNLHVDDLEGSSSSFGVDLEVIPVNDPPVITSDPDRTAVVNKLYGFVLTATDPEGDDITKSVVDIPSFLNFDSNTGILGGAPTEGDLGEHIVALKVSDGIGETPLTFTISVLRWPVGIHDEVELVERVYPNPANDQLIVEYDIAENGTLTVIDMTGKQLIKREVFATLDKIHLDLTELEEGLYMYRFQSGEYMSIRSFIISR